MMIQSTAVYNHAYGQGAYIYFFLSELARKFSGGSEENPSQRGRITLTIPQSITVDKTIVFNYKLHTKQQCSPVAQQVERVAVINCSFPEKSGLKNRVNSGKSIRKWTILSQAICCNGWKVQRLSRNGVLITDIQYGEAPDILFNYERMKR